MHIILDPLISLLCTVLGLYLWAVVLSVALSWLIIFNVVNTKNDFILNLSDFLFRITDPILARIRTKVPMVGNVDLSPLVLILGLYFLEGILVRLR
jgi:YggT family protein